MTIKDTTEDPLNSKEVVQTVKRFEELMGSLRCPHCKHGIQIEERHCIQGYIQYKCTSCGYVEPYNCKSTRVYLIIFTERDKENKKGPVVIVGSIVGMLLAFVILTMKDTIDLFIEGNYKAATVGLVVSVTIVTLTRLLLPKFFKWIDKRKEEDNRRSDSI